MKRRQPPKRKRSTRRRRRVWVMKVKLSDQPVDIDAFLDGYARALIREVEEQRTNVQPLATEPARS